MLIYSNGYWEVYKRFQGEEWDMIADLSMEEFVTGKKISMKGAQDFLALFKKKQWKNKYEKFVSTESEEQY